MSIEFPPREVALAGPAFLKRLFCRNVIKCFVYILNSSYFLKYDKISAYPTHYWFSIHEYELESGSKKIRNMRNLSNFQICGPRIDMSRTDKQIRLDIIFTVQKSVVDPSLLIMVRIYSF